MSLAIRDMQAGDKAYVQRTWTADYWPHAPKTPHQQRAVNRSAEWDRAHNRAIDESLNAGMRVLIAFDDTEPEVIVGFVAFTPDPGRKCLHYVYVRNAFRRNGIGKALTRAADLAAFAYSHWTPDLALMWKDSTKPVTAQYASPQLFPVRKP